MMSARPSTMGREIKTISGRDYLYFSYYDESAGGRKTVYCGRAGDVASKRKAAETELQLINDRMKALQDAKKALERELAGYDRMEDAEIRKILSAYKAGDRDTARRLLDRNSRMIKMPRKPKEKRK